MAAPLPISACFVLAAAAAASLSLAQDTCFTFSSFRPDRQSILYLGDASCSRGVMDLTLNSATESLQRSSGRALFHREVHVWDRFTNATASFSTAFTFSIQRFNASSFGDGLAFIFTSNASSLPSDSYGGWLGLFNQQNNGNDGNHLIAIEFDTFRNSWDPDDNHVGLDINSIASVVTSNLNAKSIALKNNRNITAWIDYDGKEKILRVYVAESSLIKPVGEPVLVERIDLSAFLFEYMYVGFSAATGLNSETHTLYAWNFSSSGLPNTKRDEKLAIAGATILGAIVILSVIAALVQWWSRRVSHDDDVGWEPVEWIIEESDFGPRKFAYKDLKKATKKFSPERTLGQGGFGSVYRGVLPDNKKVVAIKRVSKQSKQGMREFVAEVRIIGRLRHRNLVPLQGWCHDRGELLLVYDYMPNGSLDKMIFRKDGQILDWDRRYKIVCGVAAALLYLHEGWEQQVVHRDVKASNVLLDSDFNARLGDFGLARLIAHDNSAETTIVAGTPGYLAPEYVQTGKATKESDVFSFGALVLEVACGRRPMDGNLPANEAALTDWVWHLHKEGRLLDAADPKLAGAYNSEEMMRLLLLGLACSHPDPTARPSARQAMDILMKDFPPPEVPLSKPVTRYGPLPPMSVNELLSQEIFSQSSLMPHKAVTSGSLDKPDKASSSSLREPLLGER